MNTPLLVASANGAVGMDAGWQILSGGGSALDAVEAATRLVEDNPLDHTVGYNGYPNVLGELELDASIMDGTARRCGAVGGLKGFRAAITVARAVMDRLPHVFLAGDGAARFAAEIGLSREDDLLTDEVRERWRQGVDGKLPEGSPGRWVLSRLTELATDPERVSGTVNFIARDAAGRIASAVSTSGWAWKYPGRLGDSPVVGAGNYADDRYGAAACTGYGELAIRGATAVSVVHALRAGAPLADACRGAITDLDGLADGGAPAVMSLVAIDAHGNHHAVSTREGASYCVRTTTMPSHETLPRELVPIT